MGFVGNYLANLPHVWLGREPSRPLLFSWYVTHHCELLERKDALVDVLTAGSYAAALQAARRQAGAIPRCADGCQIFCHMGLSLFQVHPGMALRELRHWSH
jgi:hypothetical protein